MNEDKRLPDEDATLGEPVDELKLLSESPDPGLLGRVRNSINRRNLVADSLDLTLVTLCETFFEYLKTTIQALGDNEGRRKEP